MSEAKPELRLVEPVDDGGLSTLELISQARQALTAARTLPDVRRVMETAAVAVDAAQRAARLFNAERRARDVVEAATAAANDAAAVRIEAQAKAGELLKQLRRSGEREGTGRAGDERVSHDATPHTLRDLGVSRSESSRWQQVAEVPEEERREYVEATKKAKGEVSTAGLLRHLKTASGTVAGRAADAIEEAEGDPGPGEPAKVRLAHELRTLMAALLTYPTTAAADLDGDERVGLERTVRRVERWFGCLLSDLQPTGLSNDFERVEAAYTGVINLSVLCGGATGVAVEVLVDAIEAADRSDALSAIRAVNDWLAELEGELIRRGAADPDEREPQS